MLINIKEFCPLVYIVAEIDNGLDNTCTYLSNMVICDIMTLGRLTFTQASLNASNQMGPTMSVRFQEYKGARVLQGLNLLFLMENN